MPKAWSAKRERQYEHVKESQEDRGTAGGRTYDQLRNEARARGIQGRWRTRKAQLERVLGRRDIWRLIGLVGAAERS